MPVAQGRGRTLLPLAWLLSRSRSVAIFEGLPSAYLVCRSGILRNQTRNRRALVFAWRDFGVGLSNPALSNLTNSHRGFNDRPLSPLLMCFSKEGKSLCDPESTLSLSPVVFLCESAAFAGNQAASDIPFKLASEGHSCPAGRYISGFSDYIKTGPAGAPPQWHR